MSFFEVRRCILTDVPLPHHGCISAFLGPYAAALAASLSVGAVWPGALLQPWLPRCLSALFGPALLQPWLPRCLSAPFGPHCCSPGCRVVCWRRWPALLQPWLPRCLSAPCGPRCCSPGCFVDELTWHTLSGPCEHWASACLSLRVAAMFAHLSVSALGCRCLLVLATFPSISSTTLKFLFRAGIGSFHPVQTLTSIVFARRSIYRAGTRFVSFAPPARSSCRTSNPVTSILILVGETNVFVLKSVIGNFILRRSPFA